MFRRLLQWPIFGEGSRGHHPVKSLYTSCWQITDLGYFPNRLTCATGPRKTSGRSCRRYDTVGGREGRVCWVSERWQGRWTRYIIVTLLVNLAPFLYILFTLSVVTLLVNLAPAVSVHPFYSKCSHLADESCPVSVHPFYSKCSLHLADESCPVTLDLFYSRCWHLELE